MKTSLGILGGMLALQVLLVLGFVAVAARNRSVPSGVVCAVLAVLLVVMWIGVLVLLPIFPGGGPSSAD
jgi:hypothetical protein